MRSNDATTQTLQAHASDTPTTGTRGWIPAQPGLLVTSNPWRGRSHHSQSTSVTHAAKPVWLARLQSRARTPSLTKRLPE